MHILLFLFLACTGPSNPTPPQANGAETTDLKAAGESCLAAAECASGICEGQGCDDASPGTCMPDDLICTMDAVQYCGCDGETFVSSGSCPGRRYKDRGMCEGEELPTTLEDPVKEEASTESSARVGSETGPRGDGMSCQSDGECASGICEGEGCGPDNPGTCQPKQRACTRDIKMFCGCDGQTFRGSSSCPGGRYASVGACEGDAPDGPKLKGLPQR